MISVRQTLDNLSPQPDILSKAGAANGLFDALGQAQLTNSAWYASNSRRFYAPLLSWYLVQAAQPGAGSNLRLEQRLATCYYEMGMYPQWEEEQKQAGLMPAREIEKALRWDGVTDVDHEYDVVTKFLAAHPEIEAANHIAVDTLQRRQVEIDRLAKRGKPIGH